MAGDGVAVIEMAKLPEVKTHLAVAVESEAYSLPFDFRDRSELAIGDPFRSVWSANLHAIALCKGTLGLVVNTHAGKSFWVINELAAISKANRDLVLLMVGCDDLCIITRLRFVDLAGVVVANHVLAGSVGIGEGALGAGHIAIDINLDLMIVAAHFSFAL